jgi:dienelactone hydrolase
VNRLNRRRWLMGAAALAAASAWPLHQASASAPFEALDMDWADTARQRPVPVRLYLPAAPAAATPAPVPLVVFSHGIGGSRRGYSWLGQHFATHGIAALHLQHVGSDRQLWGGNPISLIGRLQAAAQAEEALARVQDLRFALNTLLGGPLQARIDAQRILMAGHSYGANTTLLACGAQAEHEGRPVQLHDDRLRGAIIISAPPFYGQGDPARILQSVQVPSLHVTATEDIIRIPGYYSGAEDRVAVFHATGSRRKWLAMFEGGSHSMFTDRAGTGGVTLNPQVKEATRALSLAFVKSVFEGDDSGMRVWPQAHAGILAKVEGFGR